MIKIIFFLSFIIFEINAEVTTKQFNELCSTHHPDKYSELFYQFNQTFKEYLANCLFDVAQNSFAKGSQDFLREQQNGNLKKIAQILMNAVENNNDKQLLNGIIRSIL